MADPEDLVALVRRGYGLAFDGPVEERLETIRQLYAEDVVDHNMGEGQAPGRQGSSTSSPGFPSSFRT